MTALRTLDAGTVVAGQIDAASISALKAAGVTTIVNNRPDDEEAGQPRSQEIRQAAEAAGLAYHSAPIRGFPDDGAVQTVSEALAQAEREGGRALLFCKSGMRSTAAWALARHAGGEDADTLRAAAAQAGYDLSRLPL